MRWSSMTRSTSRWARISSAAAPCSASSTSHVSSRIARMEARTPSSSSTTSTVPRRRVVSGGSPSTLFIGVAFGAPTQGTSRRLASFFAASPRLRLRLLKRAAARTTARRSAGQPVHSSLLAALQHDVLIAAAGGPMHVDQGRLAGRDSGERLAEALRVRDRLARDLQNDVAAPQAGAVGGPAAGDVDDDQAVRDEEVETLRRVG